jgi:hypothetical protein
MLDTEKVKEYKDLVNACQTNTSEHYFRYLGYTEPWTEFYPKLHQPGTCKFSIEGNSSNCFSKNYIKLFFFYLGVRNLTTKVIESVPGQWKRASPINQLQQTRTIPIRILLELIMKRLIRYFNHLPI